MMATADQTVKQSKPTERPPKGGMSRPGLRTAIGFQNISAVYLLVLVVIVFAIWIPEKFFNTGTLAQVFNENAAPGIVALALVVPLAAGIYDLSIGFILGTVSVFVAYMLGHTDLAPAVCVGLGLLMGVAIGCVNGFIVVFLRVDSFIGTLASGSLLQALIIIISGNTPQTEGITEGFTDIARQKIGSFTLPVFYMLAIATVLWFFLEYRAVGRRTHAAGLAPEAARLAGIRVDMIRFSSLVVSALLAAVAGILVTATVGGGSPEVGGTYLIPAFAAAFLGATQLKGGLFNAWGTVLTVILLGTTYTGLTLAGVPIWTPYIVTGVVLIAALALAGVKRRSSGSDSSTPDELSEAKPQ
jgi:ribose transport system permease protein